MTTLQEDGWNRGYFDEMNTPKYDTVFSDTPDSVLYTLFNEDLQIVSSSEKFVFPAEIGDYILRIDVFDTEYYARIVVGEPRGWCDRIDRHHGGGEGLMVYDFDTLMEINALLAKDDKAIADYFKSICDREDERRSECPCFIRTKADLQSFFSWTRLDHLRLPFSDTASLENILLRDSYADIYVRYTIDDMRFNFIYQPFVSYDNEESIEGVRDNGIVEWSVEWLTSVDDVDVYIYRITDHFEISDFSELPEDPRVIFILSIDGMQVELGVSIDCKNPETCENGQDYGRGHSCNGEWVDRQAAIDGIKQFTFTALLPY